MSDMIHDGMTWLAGKLATSAAQDVTYVRENKKLPVRATIGRTEYQVADEFGVVREVWTDRDYIIPTAGFEFTIGKSIVPQRNDFIHEIVNGKTLVYEVITPGNEPEAKLLPHREAWRIHTKYIGTK